MSSPVFINKLNKDLAQYYCRVLIGNSLFFYTKLNRLNVPDSEDENYILMYNLITEKIDKVNKDNIIQYTLIHDKIVDNIKIETAFINRCKEFYKITKEKGYTDKFFNDNFLNEFVVDHNLLDILIAFDFTLDAKSIQNSNIDKSKLNKVISSFKKLILKKVEENKNELDLLLEDCETEEDIEDIETIKEMFDSSFEEIEYENVNNIMDLIDLWPPILMPLPGNMEDLKSINFSVFETQSVNDELKEIINNINDDNLIKEFIEILDKEKDNIEEDFYKEIKTILDERL